MGYGPWRSQRVGHDWETFTSTCKFWKIRITQKRRWKFLIPPNKESHFKFGYVPASLFFSASCMWFFFFIFGIIYDFLPYFSSVDFILFPMLLFLWKCSFKWPCNIHSKTYPTLLTHFPIVGCSHYLPFLFFLLMITKCAGHFSFVSAQPRAGLGPYGFCQRAVLPLTLLGLRMGGVGRRPEVGKRIMVGGVLLWGGHPGGLCKKPPSPGSSLQSCTTPHAVITFCPSFVSSWVFLFAVLDKFLKVHQQIETGLWHFI